MKKCTYPRNKKMSDKIYWTSNEKEEFGEFNIHGTHRKKKGTGTVQDLPS